MCGWAIGYNCAINFTSHAGSQIIGIGAGLAGLLLAGQLFQRFIIKIALRTCLLLPDHFKKSFLQMYYPDTYCHIDTEMISCRFFSGKTKLAIMTELVITTTL